MKNSDLKSVYDSVYKSGAYENFFSFNPFLIHQAILNSTDWINKKVIDVGCGQGELAAMIKFAGASEVVGVDFSEEAIRIASTSINIENISFKVQDFNDTTDVADVVVMAGILEHIDDPFHFLDKTINNNLSNNGVIITVMPNFMNLRGMVWMTLAKLLSAPMSLTDIHFFSPTQIFEYAESRNLLSEIITIDNDWGNGEKMILDFKKRLPNVLNDLKIDASGVDELLRWLDDARNYFDDSVMNGALMCCTLKKKL